MDLIDEVIGYAKANADAARGSERETWAAHERNCIRVKAEIAELRAQAAESDRLLTTALELRDQARQDAKELRAALKPFAEIALVKDTYPDAEHDAIDGPDLAVTPKMVRTARTALGLEQRGGDSE